LSFSSKVSAGCGPSGDTQKKRELMKIENPGVSGNV
jgi:hypothetical protein